MEMQFIGTIEMSKKGQIHYIIVKDLDKERENYGAGKTK